MARKVLVSLVSDQTIPNFLFIKTFTEIDIYLFVTTTKMEDYVTGNKREWTIKAANIPVNLQEKIVVDPENKEDVITKLNSFDWENYDEIIVNVTGGTKMMSIATYEFFKPKTDQLWYLLIGKNSYIQCDNVERTREITHFTTVEEYLNCCGIFKSENRYNEKLPLFTEDFVSTFYQNVIENNIKFSDLENIRMKFRADEAPFREEMKKRKKIDLNLIEDFAEIKSFLLSIKFPLKDDTVLTKPQMEFLTGGWFEEYTYYAFKTITGLKDEYFKIGVALTPKAGDKEKAKYFTNNDLDVVFVYNNNLYVVECKSAGMEDSDLYNKTVYLASALKKYFGLSVKSVLCTLSEMKFDQIEKAETLGVTALSREIFLNPEYKNEISTKLKFKR